MSVVDSTAAQEKTCDITAGFWGMFFAQPVKTIGAAPPPKKKRGPKQMIAEKREGEPVEVENYSMIIL